MSRRATSVALFVAVLSASSTLYGAPPALNVRVAGLELAPQSLAGAAIFVFQVDGEVNGRQRHGLGWIAVRHDALPEMEGDTANVIVGKGAVYLGFRRYDVEVTGGQLVLTDAKKPEVFDDEFQVGLDVNICLGRDLRSPSFHGNTRSRALPPDNHRPACTQLATQHMV